MDIAQADGFLDVDRLLETSQPAPRISLLWWFGGALLLTLLMAGLSGESSLMARQVIGVLSMLVMFGAMTAMFAVSFYTVRRFAAEHQRVDQMGEMIQLRRWSEAGLALELYLSHPARSHHLRTRALGFLAAMLVRLERFEDAIKVQTYLIDEKLVDPGNEVGLRLARTVAMLREDHLFDADRAISELRRGPAAGSGALALIELYRDVKTGHPTEAIETFQAKRTILRDQLGHRLADAYALAARAYDLLGNEAQARQAYHDATLLAPPAELLRRYPEVAKLADRYPSAPAPREAA